MTCSQERFQAVNLEKKSGDGVPIAAYRCIQRRSGYSYGGAGTMCIGVYFSSESFQRHGEGGSGVGGGGARGSPGNLLHG